MDFLRSIMVAASGLRAQNARMQIISENIANAQTVGFRAGQVRFEEVVKQVSGEDTSFSSDGVEYLDVSPGGLEQTGNPLDFAVRGDAWFAAQTPAGAVVTRDGRFTMSNNGDLVTLSGFPVLDPGGAPITLDPAGGTPELGDDGILRQNGRLVGAIGLFEFQPGPNYQRYGNSGILVGGEPQPVVDNPDVGIVQGRVELSNVDALSQMTELIMVQRTFEQAASLTETSEDAVQQLIRAFNAG